MRSWPPGEQPAARRCLPLLPAAAACRCCLPLLPAAVSDTILCLKAGTVQLRQMWVCWPKFCWEAPRRAAKMLPRGCGGAASSSVFRESCPPALPPASALACWLPMLFLSTPGASLTSRCVNNIFRPCAFSLLPSAN